MNRWFLGNREIILPWMPAKLSGAANMIFFGGRVTNAPKIAIQITAQPALAYGFYGPSANAGYAVRAY